MRLLPPPRLIGNASEQPRAVETTVNGLPFVRTFAEDRFVSSMDVQIVLERTDVNVTGGESIRSCATLVHGSDPVRVRRHVLPKCGADVAFSPNSRLPPGAGNPNFGSLPGLFVFLFFQSVCIFVYLLCLMHSEDFTASVRCNAVVNKGNDVSELRGTSGTVESAARKYDVVHALLPHSASNNKFGCCSVNLSQSYEYKQIITAQVIKQNVFHIKFAIGKM